MKEIEPWPIAERAVALTHERPILTYSAGRPARHNGRRRMVWSPRNNRGDVLVALVMLGLAIGWFLMAVPR